MRVSSKTTARIKDVVHSMAMLLGLTLWVLVNQPLPTLPAMRPGTEVRIVLPDLVTMLGRAVVEDEQLLFHELRGLEPNREVRILISHAEQGEFSLFTARVDAEGSDLRILFNPDAPQETISLRTWLAAHYGIHMILVTP